MKRPSVVDRGSSPTSCFVVAVEPVSAAKNVAGKLRRYGWKTVVKKAFTAEHAEYAEDDYKKEGLLGDLKRSRRWNETSVCS